MQERGHNIPGMNMQQYKRIKCTFPAFEPRNTDETEKPETHPAAQIIVPYIQVLLGGGI